MVAAVLSSCTERKTEVLDDPNNPDGGGNGGKTAEVIFNAGVNNIDTKLATDLSQTDAGKATIFTEGDQIGIFATTEASFTPSNPYPLTPYGYQRTNEETDASNTSQILWKATGASLVWKKLATTAGDNDHNFYAFYPYNSATTTKEKVVLPSVADQVHTDVDITVEDFKLIDLTAPYDFLVAQKLKTDYKSASNRTPKVDGALDMAFTHALSLIEVNVIRANGAFSEKNIEVSSVMVSANTLTSKRTANLTKDPKRDADFWSKAGAIPGTVGITFASTGNEKGEIKNFVAGKNKAPWLDKTNHSVDNSGNATAAKTATPAKIYFVTYPTPANTEYQFEIEARSVKDDNTQYVKTYPLAAVYTAADKFESGKKYTFTISISDRALTVMDLTITNWEDGEDYPVVEI